MKGQYLAVETVFTFGLGLMVAVGVITLFNQYKTDVLTSAEPEQAEMVQSEILLAMDALRESDEAGNYGEGSYEINLPDTVAGKSYNLDMGQNLRLIVGTNTYTLEMTGYSGYNLQGSASGGDITVFKEGNNYTISAQ